MKHPIEQAFDTIENPFADKREALRYLREWTNELLRMAVVWHDKRSTYWGA